MTEAVSAVDMLKQHQADYSTQLEQAKNSVQLITGALIGIANFITKYELAEKEAQEKEELARSQEEEQLQKELN